MDEQEQIPAPSREPAAERSKQPTETREIIEQLRLHEERAVVEVVPEQMGAVIIRRVVSERQETVPITLHSEHLEITVKADTGGRVTLDGEVLEVGRLYEVPLYEERALVEKQIYPLSDVSIARQARAYTHTEQITLRREELDISDPQGMVRDRVMPDPLDPQL